MIQATVTIAAALLACTAGISSAHAQQDMSDPWAPLNLIDVECDQCRLRIDPKFRDHIDEIETWVSGKLAEHREMLAPVSEITTNAPEIIARVNEILGFEPNESQSAEQRDLLHASVRSASLPLAPADGLTLIVVQKDTVKDHLRQGGRLPRHSYDEWSDQVTFEFNFEQSVREDDEDARDVVVRELPIAVTGIDDLDGAPRPEFLDETDLSSLVLAGLTEASMHQMVGVVDPCGHWFFTGLAQPIAMVVLREHGMHSAADALADWRDVSRFEAIPRSELLLRYWPNPKFTLVTESREFVLPYEERLFSARNAWAVHECRRIIDDHGIEIVAKIMRTAAQQENVKSQYLVGIVAQVTGDDLSSRLNDYQAFGADRDGILEYNRRFLDARDAGDYETALVALSRQIEIMLRSGMPAEAYAAAAATLGEMNRIEVAAAIIAHQIRAYESDYPKWVPALHEIRMNACVRFGRPDLAYDSIEPVLEILPDHPVARLVRAHRLCYLDDNPVEARKQAEQLLLDDRVEWEPERRAMLEAIVAETDDD